MASLLLSAAINGLIAGATLFLVAVGLSLIFGTLRILNVAHGSFYAIGAFAAASAWLAIAGLGWPPYLIYPALILVALTVGVAIGPLIERWLLRWTYAITPLAARETLQLLATFALFLVLEDAQKWIWGVQPYYSGNALALLGRTDIGGIPYSNYEILLVPLALLTLVGLRLWLNLTRNGRFVRAVAADPEMASALGIAVGHVYTMTFAVGTTLAALGGALSSPAIGVSAGIGADMMVLSFAVVAIAGLGEIEGVALAALLIGFSRALAVFFAPEFSEIAAYGLMVAVLLIKPHGLFVRAGQRRL